MLPLLAFLLLLLLLLFLFLRLPLLPCRLLWGPSCSRYLCPPQFCSCCPHTGSLCSRRWLLPLSIPLLPSSPLSAHFF